MSDEENVIAGEEKEGEDEEVTDLNNRCVIGYSWAMMIILFRSFGILRVDLCKRLTRVYELASSLPSWLKLNACEQYWQLAGS